MSSIWLTGADGFVGGWLRGALEQQGKQWTALGLVPPGESDLGSFSELDLAAWAKAPVEETLAAWDQLPEPEGLIHLAALSSPPACEANPELAQAINVDGPQRMYTEFLQRWPDCPIVHVSSGHVYRPASEPLSEDEQLEPINVYGATKLRGEAMAMELREKGHRITVVRPFNHTGAGQLPAFALPSFAMRLAGLEAKGGGTLAVGRLDAVRDFLHVRDVVRAYLDLLEYAGKVDLLNICSGQGVVIGELLDSLVTRFEGDIEVQQEEARLRGAADANVLVGSNRRLQNLLGYAPKLDVSALLDELAVDARARVAAGESLEQA
ncbi:MAG: NAD-dependent epimerase/dehydratase family protein [Planctomycetota bacterium]|nr:NAD-dependent epimerase/dehydratase family protein [Planctomycetota bacterium]MDA1114762.1 NAD-dependent epimerase/dehydratase family protein [Planctomycetota bacterium]